MNYGRKIIAGLILSAGMNLGAFSQSSQDSVTCIPNQDLRAALKIINNLRTDSVIKDRDIRLLNVRVASQRETIGQLNGRITTYQTLTGNYQQQVTNLTRQNEIVGKLNNELSRQVRREKTKTTIAWVTGAAAVVFSIYLTTK